MKIAVAGAGKLGVAVAQVLLGGGNDVTLIDPNENLLTRVGSRLDVYTVAGDARSLSVLKDIGIGSYDVMVAATETDETNMVICSFAKRLGCRRVVARVRAPEHVAQSGFIMETMGIDNIVNPDRACAREIYRYLTEKYDLEGGRYTIKGLSILEFSIDRIKGLADKYIKNIPPLIDNLLVGAISRDGKIIVPNGNTKLLAGDTIYVIGPEERILPMSKKVHDKKAGRDLNSVMIAGGGKTGYFLAKMLTDYGISVKIIENSKIRCDYLSDNLSQNALILHGDASDITLLEDENLDGMDAFVAVTGFDEENLLLGMMARQHGVEDVVAKVSHNSFGRLTESLGVSMILNPVDICATNVMRFIRQEKDFVFSKIIQGQAEFVEVRIVKGMKITEGTLRDMTIPDGVLIAAVRRDGQLLVPGGNTRIQPGDQVLILSLLTSITELEALIKY